MVQWKHCIAVRAFHVKKMTSLLTSEKTVIHLTQFSNKICRVDGLFSRALSAAFLPFVRQRVMWWVGWLPSSKKIIIYSYPITQTIISGNTAGKLLRIYFTLCLIIIFKVAKQIRCFQIINCRHIILFAKINREVFFLLVQHSVR